MTQRSTRCLEITAKLVSYFADENDRSICYLRPAPLSRWTSGRRLFPTYDDEDGVGRQVDAHGHSAQWSDWRRAWHGLGRVRRRGRGAVPSASISHPVCEHLTTSSAPATTEWALSGRLILGDEVPQRLRPRLGATVTIEAQTARGDQDVKYDTGDLWRVNLIGSLLLINRTLCWFEKLHCLCLLLSSFTAF